jgi:hypothetical protein
VVGSTPALSVVVATFGGAEGRRCLQGLGCQAHVPGVELIVADGGPGSSEATRTQGTVWISSPGATIFELRAMALARARGEVVAITEDHCQPHPEWCQQVITAHREHPGVMAIAGAIENGATGRLMDWAGFLLTAAPFMAPAGPEPPPDRAVTMANLSIKRALLPEGQPAPGWLELTLPRTLSDNRELLLDDRIVMSHVHSLSSWGWVKQFFHNGRAVAGLDLLGTAPGVRSQRLRQCLSLPGRLVGTTFRLMRTNPRLRRQAGASLPLVALLAICHTAGVVCGLAAGPGHSARVID